MNIEEKKPYFLVFAVFSPPFLFLAVIFIGLGALIGCFIHVGGLAFTSNRCLVRSCSGRHGHGGGRKMGGEGWSVGLRVVSRLLVMQI